MDRPIRLTSGPRDAGAAVRMLFQVVSAAIGFAAVWLSIGAMTLYLAFVATLVAGLVVYLVRVFGERSASWGAAPLSGVLTVSWLGLALTFDLAGALWVGALALTLPPVMSLWWRRPGRAPAVPAQPAEAEVLRTFPRRHPDEVAGLDVEALCLVWRRSYVQLQRSGLGLHNAGLVDYRQLVLDELANRDPDGISRWLASSPRAAGNPMPFLCPDTEEPTGVS